MSLDNILKQCDGKEIYVYGCGLHGMIVTSWVDSHGKNIKGIVISDRKHREIEEYITIEKNKLDVLEINDVKCVDKTNVLFINTVVAGKESVEKLLYERDFAVITDIDDYLPEIIQEFGTYCCEKLGINPKDDFLTIGNVRCYNPLDINEPFLAMIGDELLPLINETFLMSEGPYEYGNVICNPGDVVIDTGTNVGYFACYAANKGCKVYACEPDRHAIVALMEQQKLYPEIEIIEKGVSDKCGEITFHEMELSTHSNIDRVDKLVGVCEEAATTTIELTTIDDIVDTYKLSCVNYINADIEGSERYMLKGAAKTLKTFAPKLAICTYHCPDDKEVLEQIIKEANPEYVVEHRWRKLYAYVPEK